MTALYFVRGAALGLAWLLLVNVLTSAAIARITTRLGAGHERSPAFWLTLRLFPAAVSLAFVAGVFAPSYWRYEPRQTGESFDATLVALALAGSALLAAAMARGMAAWLAAARRGRAWKRLARPLALDDATLPLYAVDSAAPIMALAGVFRPRLLITRGVLEALTGDEVRAGVAHELGHWRARDNMKRLAMRAAPDLLVLTHAAAALESRWASAAEHAADCHAGADAPTRCALASALVKIARLTPPATPLGEPISTLVDGGEIASRVERLLSDARPAAPSSRRRTVVWAGAALAAVAAAYGPLLRMVHEATELLVHTLP